MDDLDGPRTQRPKGKRSSRPTSSPLAGLSARIVRAFGRQYLAQRDHGEVVACAEVLCAGTRG